MLTKHDPENLKPVFRKSIMLTKMRLTAN